MSKNPEENQPHNEEMSCLQRCLAWNCSVNYKSSSQSSNRILYSGKNYFLNKLNINYAAQLTKFDLFKYSASFFDIFFVKSMEQNKDKIEFLKMKPKLPISFSFFNNIKDEDCFKFFVDFDLKKGENYIELNKTFSETAIEFVFNSKIHKTKLFNNDNLLSIYGSQIISLVKSRIENLKLNKKENAVNELYCNLVYNSNFNFGLVLHVGNLK